MMGASSTVTQAVSQYEAQVRKRPAVWVTPGQRSKLNRREADSDGAGLVPFWLLRHCREAGIADDERPRLWDVVPSELQGESPYAAGLIAAGRRLGLATMSCVVWLEIRPTVNIPADNENALTPGSSRIWSGPGL